jgi:long-chain acyl-CoA synthetase
MQPQRQTYNLHTLLEAGKKENPDAVWLKDQYGSWTYQEGEALVQAAALELVETHGIRPGDRVAAFLSNSRSYGLLIFALLRIGAVIVPVNVKLKEEIHYILQDADPSLLIRDQGLPGAVPSIPQLNIQDWMENVRQRTDVPEKKAEAQPKEYWDEAFIIYTSGTTGRPKGAVLHHGGIHHTIQAYIERFETDSSTKTLIAVPMFHVTGLIGQLLHLTGIGGTCVIMPRYSTTDYLKWLQKEPFTFLFNVPTIFHMLYDKSEDAFEGVQSVAFGGAPAGPVLFEQLREMFPKAVLHNCYGATETCSPATIMPKDYAKEKEGAVGTPIRETDIKVMRSDGTECSDEEIGEIYISGPMVIQRYWKNDEATKNSFSGEYWISGDFGCLDKDRYLYIKDRKKDIIIRGGENIYSIEIEQTLQQLNLVREAAVIGVPDPLYGEKVKAYIVPAGPEVTEEKVQQEASRYLAAFKIPAVISFVQELPKNPGGKILKHQLK